MMTWDYAKDLFDEDMIRAMFETYQLRLQQVIDNNLSSMPLPVTQSELLLDYNDTQGDYEGDLLQRLIDRQCQKTPDAIAVKLGQDTLTYGELARKSNQVARYLSRTKLCAQFLYWRLGRETNRDHCKYGGYFKSRPCLYSCEPGTS